MAERKYTEVVIDGRAITLSGDEDTEYMQEIASYVDGKIRELQEGGNYNRQSNEDRRLMLLFLPCGTGGCRKLQSQLFG